ncbi:MAG: spiro-SPASM protein [Treponema sp.]|jgi:spiro-SPASM protein|nr:spiro-SPASM protein [Treponema sp.]
MKAIAVLYAGNSQIPTLDSYTLFLKKIALFSNVEKIVFLKKGELGQTQIDGVQEVAKPSWTRRTVLESIAAVSAGFDAIYFAWADCPLLDAGLAERLATRHIKYRADYTFADGYPYGLAPEILAPDLAERLKSLINDEEKPVSRDMIFDILQKDINAFDIETEIAPLDLSALRLNLCTDSKRNRLLLQRLTESGFISADHCKLIEQKPELLRTLPAYYNIQVALPCPQACALCPYRPDETVREQFMSPEKFSWLLDRIVDFSGDAVIGLSMWGELSLHPQKLDLIALVLDKPSLSLVIETSALGWKTEELESIKAMAEKARTSEREENETLAKISWIASLDAFSAERYQEVRGPGFTSAVETARTLNQLFSKDAYVQAVRVSGAEDDIERFYRYWKAEGANVIIQKHNNFCGVMPTLRVTDLSPCERRPCWRLMRDMAILIGGDVPMCRDVGIGRSAAIMGNVFVDNLETIWEKGDVLFREQCARKYSGECGNCDEYYIFNF